MEQIIISAFVASMLALLINRKHGPFGIFRFVKNNRILNPVLKCETCTTLWFSFIVFTLYSLSLGIIPKFPGFFFHMLASGGLALAVSAIAQSMVDQDGE